MQQSERQTSPLWPPDAPRGPAAPTWVLAVGAALLLMALALTVYGPRTVRPTPTRSVGVAAGARPVAVAPAAEAVVDPSGSRGGN